ncbi:hypothetical protein D9V86_03485 [Bacteroidetes/Chlorobi group bacterium ChocPot_Mid]|nr:MAG: hypothetical protein D9V86_03485 [Bacteroidetes/Chlorobi group bacterium ChocPot_Mid]
MKKIYFFFIILIFTQTAYSQYSDSIAAIVRADSFLGVMGDTIRFELKIINTSDRLTTTSFRWDRWANTTIQFGFTDSTFSFDSTDFIIEQEIDPKISNKIDLGISGSLLPERYYLTPRVFNNRISITVLGPEKYEDCIVINQGDTLHLGTFYFISKNRDIPFNTIKFSDTPDPDPYFYYQALAAKVNNEVKIRNIKWYNPDDNVELNNSALGTKVRYEIDLNMPPMKVDTFYVEYAGQKKDTLIWITSSEPVHKGFILKRKLVPYGTKYEEDKQPFSFVVGRWDAIRKPTDTLLIGNITHMYGYDYRYEFDTVPYRDEKYCYQLSYTTLEGDTIALDTACIDIPDVLIYSAKTNPNPFSETTQIEFRLEEESIVSCIVYDIEGRVVAKVFENMKLGVGLHKEFSFQAQVFAPQGLYDIVIYAVPTESMPIKKGRAVIKAQLLR